MKKLKSYCKINTFLDVGKIINSQKLHNIKSLIFILNLHDEILIEKKNMIKDKISFHGKFKSKIKKKNNSVQQALSLLRQKQYIKDNENFNIKVIKKIPVFSGLGGGSSNAAAIVKYFVNQKKISKKEIDFFSKRLGSDFRIFFNSTQIYQKNLFDIVNLKKKHKFFFVIVFPFLYSSTKYMYSKFRNLKRIRSRRNYEFFSKIKVLKNLKKEQNSLQRVVINKYPKIKKILNALNLLEYCQFSRVTGSGSASFGLFLTQRGAELGLKKIKKKFPKYWCVTGKTI